MQFIFGLDARRRGTSWPMICRPTPGNRCERPARYQVKTQPRSRPEHVKEQIVRERGFKNIRLEGEEVAEFPYRPVACRKSLSHDRGPQEPGGGARAATLVR